MEGQTLTIIFGIGGYILAFIIFIIDHQRSKKSDKKLNELLIKITELGKNEEVIYEKTIKEYMPSEIKPEPKIQKKSIWNLITGTTEPQIQPQSTYDLSSRAGTTDPTIKSLFDYGKKKLGEAVIDSMIDSVFGEEEAPYECPKCGAEIYSEDKYCPICGVELE